jgi:hypothetical protein
MTMTTTPSSTNNKRLLLLSSQRQFLKRRKRQHVITSSRLLVRRQQRCQVVLLVLCFVVVPGTILAHVAGNTYGSVSLLLLLSSSVTTTIGPSFLFPVITHAREWSDTTIASSGNNGHHHHPHHQQHQQQQWLSKAEISSMRVRDIKRRLARTYGYGADELAKMIDKKDLISALLKEEHRQQQKEQDQIRRQWFFQGLWTTLVAVVVVMGWPLWKHVYEVMMVNGVVYTDRKLLEIQKCRQYPSLSASMGVLLMIVVDILQVWLTVSVLLSWVMKSKYFFPMPTLAIRPAQLMGEKFSQGALGRYGMNVAPMVVTWTLKFVRGHIERFTAKALSYAYQQHKHNVRATETEEERVARKAQRKATKRAAKEEAAQREQQRWQQQVQSRKEMAEQATQQLFGRRQQQQQQQQSPPPMQQQQQSSSSFQPAAEEDEDVFQDDDDFLSDDDDDAQKAKQQFEADLQQMDINDLD